MLKFDLPKNQSSLIKVIGVGGGGSNAVTHMYRQGIKGVDFVICNTDLQAMEASSVPVKLPLGANLTGGLGAGAVPSIGKNAALENIDEIRKILESGTKMVFITAGLGGGTGTGAAPVIASVAKEMGILTVGIVTIPFSFEGRKRKQHAEQGINELKKYVDALVIICNDKLRQLYGDQRLSAAFGHADDILTTAAKGIAEIITVTGYINVDFEDVKTVMKESGVAIMGSGKANGQNRAEKAIEEALNSPLLNDNDIEGANNLLLYISSGKEEITMDEVTEITDYIQKKTKNSAEVIWGNGIDESLEDNISVTIIATGFDEEHRRKANPADKVLTIKPLYDIPANPPVKKVVPSVPLSFEPILDNNDEPAVSVNPEQPDLEEEPALPEITEPLAYKMNEPDEVKTPADKEENLVSEPEPKVDEPEIPERVITFEFDSLPEPEVKNKPDESTGEGTGIFMKPAGAPVHEVSSKTNSKPAWEPETVFPSFTPESDKKHIERVQKLKALSEKLKNQSSLETHLNEIENVPAYKRRNIELNDVLPSSESQIAKYSLTENPDKTIEIKTDNAFLHNNVD